MYHEYQSADGKLRRQHNNGRRPRQEVGQMIVAQMERDRQRYMDLAWTLVDLIGKPAFDQWVDEVLPDNLPWAEACQWVEQELSRFDCSCTPVHDPCHGCQRLAQARRGELSYSQSSIGN